MEIDYGTYAFKVVSYYFWYLCDLFVGFPLVIQICILIIMLSICVGIYLLCQTVYLYVIKHKEKKIMDKFIELYRDPMIEIGNDDVIHEPDEIAEMMNYDRRKPFSVREKRLLVQMIADTKTEITDTRTDAGETINRTNFHNIIMAFGLQSFFASELQFSRTKYKVRALTWLRFLEENVPGAVITPLLYSRNNDLRKAAQATFMWNSVVEPFRFFDDNDYDRYYRDWDRIDIHSILANRRKVGLTIPNVAHWVKDSRNEKLKPFFASEIRYLDKSDECDELFDTFIRTSDTALKCEIARTLGAMKYTADEENLVEVYKAQTEVVKVAIIRAVVDMNTGLQLDFLEQCYDEASDYSVKFAAALAMHDYGVAGRALFDIKQRHAGAKYRWIFDHINDPIINRDRERRGIAV